MMKQKILLLILISSVFFLSACSQDNTDPETKIRQVISSMEAAVEKRSLDDIKEYIDPGYNDEWNTNRRSMLRSLMFYYQGHQSIHLLTRINEIAINDDSTAATVILYVGMAGNKISESEALLNLDADLYRFRIDMVAVDNNWLVKTAQWQQARPESFGR